MSCGDVCVGGQALRGKASFFVGFTFSFTFSFTFLLHAAYEIHTD